MTTWTARIFGLGVGVAASPAAAQVYQDGYGMWHGTWGWGYMIFGGLLMVLFWAAIIIFIVLAVRWAAGSSDERRRPVNSALQILEERFARGEIDRDEFEERKQVLAGRADAPRGRSR